MLSSEINNHERTERDGRESNHFPDGKVERGTKVQTGKQQSILTLLTMIIHNLQQHSLSKPTRPNEANV